MTLYTICSVLLLTAYANLATAFVIANDGCGFKEVNGFINSFQIPLPGDVWFKKQCPYKYIFSQAECGCVLPPEVIETTVPPTTTAVPVDVVTTPSNIPPPNCNFKPNPNDPFSYIQVTNDGEKTRPCSNGTIFELNPSCNCIHWDLVAPTCMPDVSIGVQNNMVRGSGNGYIVPVIQENMAVDGDAMLFSGNSRVLVNLFDSVDYNNGLTVMLEFQEMSNLTTRQVLVTNCDKNKQLHSFEIALNRNHVEFTIDVGKESYFQTNVEFVRGKSFKNVVAIYDGEQLTAYVDGKKGTIPQSGTIQRRSRPMIIGNTECPGSLGFKGKLRAVSIYRCVKEVTTTSPRQH